MPIEIYYVDNSGTERKQVSEPGEVGADRLPGTDFGYWWNDKTDLDPAYGEVCFNKTTLDMIELDILHTTYESGQVTPELKEVLIRGLGQTATTRLFPGEQLDKSEIVRQFGDKYAQNLLGIRVTAPRVE